MYKIYGAKAPWPFLKGLIRDNRIVWFFEETGIPYERVSLDPMTGETRSEEYSKLNPFQKVPTLETKELILTQSASILHHLASTTGKLYPTDPAEQAKHLSWLFYCMSDVEAHATQLSVLLPMTKPEEHEHAKWMLKRAETILVRALNYLDAEIGESTFLMGKDLYAADLLLGCCLYPIRDHELVQSRKNVKRLTESYFARSSFKRMLAINGL